MASTPAYAQSLEDVTLILTPHCAIEDVNTDDTILGPVPCVETLVCLGSGHCPEFSVEDPQTLRTSTLSKGDTLDIDIVVRNLPTHDIQRARVWLSYDSSVLQGTSIEIDDAFPQVTPGEEDFDVENGFVMIDATADTTNIPHDERLVIARVRFTVIDNPAGGTIISFYNVQQSGHTAIFRTSETDADGTYALDIDPGSLHVVFARQEGETCAENEECVSGTCRDGTCTSSRKLANGASCTIDTQCESGDCTDSICIGDATEPEEPLPLETDDDIDDEQSFLPNGSACTDDTECASFLCMRGICRADGEVPDGGACTVDEECENGQCSEGICQEEDSLTTTSTSSSQNNDGALASTAFSLLQVRNLRATTEKTSVYLGWDALQSSQLKAYNIYYGTTSGQYIQRKTVEGNMQSLTVRPLPEGTTYYFAVRAISQQDEESAFSQEVSIAVGNPATSTAPLALGNQPAPTNPVGDGDSVPGETGVSSTLLLFFILSAAIGTALAFRRQIVLPENPSK